MPINIQAAIDAAIAADIASATETLNTTVTSLRSQVASLDTQINGLKSQIISSNEQIANLNTQIVALNAQIALKDLEIADLKEKLANQPTTPPPTVPPTVPPPTVPPTVPPTTPSGFPDATNTGVAAGVALTASGSLIVKTAGTVIKNLNIKGDIVVDAPNVTIENCRITFSGWHGINTGDNDSSGLIIKNCEINGQGKMSGSYGIMATGTFTGNNIYGVENGIGITGDNCIVKGNYIHDLKSPGEPHYDGIAMHGGMKNVLIEGNTVVGTDTSDVFIKNDFGPIANVKVNANQLLGNPGFMVVVDGRASGGPITGVSITNNRWKRGYYGYYTVEKSNVVVSGNVAI